MTTGRLRPNIRGFPGTPGKGRSVDSSSPPMSRWLPARIALVAYGSDVNLLLVKHWLRRLRSGAATATSTWFAVPRSEPDWVDFDLGEIIDDPARWRLLLDGEALSFYALPVNAGAVDPSRDAWRFEVRMPDGVLTRYVTRLVFSAPAAAPPAAAPPAATPPAAGGTP